MPLGRAPAHLVVEDVDSPCPCNALDKLLALLVVCGLDLLLVGECFLVTLVSTVLEAVGIQRVLVLITADVGNDKLPSLVRPLVADPSLADEDGRRLGTVTRVVPVV